MCGVAEEASVMAGMIAEVIAELSEGAVGWQRVW
jgi:hypothetical protein